MSKFYHLHVHSHYSLLDGLAKIDQLVQKAKEFDMDALALTDHGAMYGVIEFYQKCKNAGIKPIIGLETYLAPRTMHDKQPKIDTNPYHLVLLAKNKEGYQNLIQIASAAHLQGYYYKPRIDKELLRRYSKGLICLTACLHGDVPSALLSGNFQKAEALVKEYQDIFGKDNFYLELQDHPNIPDQAVANQEMIELSKKTGAPLVATNDVHYLNPSDQEAHEILLCIQTGKTYDDENRLSMKIDNFSFKPPEKMLKAFSNIPEAIENTQKIASQCNLEIELGKFVLPKYDVSNGIPEDEYLRKLCQEGLKKRYGSNVSKNILERLEEELSVIKKAGFAPYFLIVQDFVNWAKKEGIFVGPGRGSAAGSLVSYLLGITEIDPLFYNLLFERFLSKEGERVAPPDIDLDFAEDRRDEVIDYITKKYGKDRVAQIVTFGTMASRAAVRDVARALGMSYSQGDEIAKLIPFGVSLDQALEVSPLLWERYKNEPEIRRLIDLARQLEGVARHASTHAAGLVIGKEALTNYVPLQKETGKEENIVTQYSMYDLEALGLLKIDILGLANLTIIQNTLKIISKTKGLQINLSQIPLDDPKVFQLLGKGETQSVFQLESEGMKKWLKELKPSRFEDIIAMVALYRPGPMNWIPDYIAAKHARKKPRYLHPKLEPILKETYGVCLSGDTQILDAKTGKLQRIDNLVSEKKSISVLALDSKNKPAEGKIIHFFDNGIKGVYGITTISGKKIKATVNHKFLTHSGWKELKNLKSGDLIATPQKLICGKRRYDLNKLRVLAYLLADGSLSSGATSYFVNKNKILLKEFEKCTKSFPNIQINRRLRQRGVIWLSPSRIKRKKEYFHQPNSILKWLRELGLKGWYSGKTSEEKFIPPFIFGLSEKHIGFFLASLWDCDGAISKKAAYYTTLSERLACDIQTLLLKLGIHSHLYRLKGYQSKRGKRNIYKIFVYDLRKFNRKLGPYLVTEKGRKLKAVLESKQNLPFQSIDYHRFISKDFALKKLKSYLKEKNLSQRKFCELGGINRRNLFKKRNVISTQVARKIAKLIGDQELLEICNAQVNWEEIKSIQSEGREKVYDVEVNDHHNLVANNIFVHNCIYQEQVMQIARELAGFTYAEADVLRKAIGKKIKKLLLAQKDKFIAGCVNNGIEKEIAEKIFEFIEPFARYSFNKSHSTCYAQIAYWTAYFKAHFPSEYMAAFLTNEQTDLDKLALAIRECRRMKIEVLPPDINESWPGFAVVPETGSIRFGLAAIKNVGEKAASLIVEERKKNGPYQSLEDFISRLGSSVLNKKILESLIKGGALDRFGERTIFLAGIDQILKFIQQANKGKQNNQLDLFGGGASLLHNSITSSLPNVSPASKNQKLAWEKELLGMHISDHPLSDFNHIWEKGDVLATSNITLDLVGKRVSIAGIITKIQRILTKNGAEMAFIKLEDIGGGIEVVVFPKILQNSGDIIQKDNTVLIKGKVSEKDRVLKILADQIRSIKEELKKPQGLFLTIPKKGNRELLKRLKEIILTHQGNVPIILKIPQNGGFKELKVKSSVEISKTLLNKLTAVLGTGKVEVK